MCDMISESSRNSQSYDRLNYGFWNINGFKSKIIGNKLKHKNFLQKFENCDVVGLAETHVHKLIIEKLSIPGFSRIRYCTRDASSKGKGSGGLALFCKPHISKYITPMSRSNPDVIWVMISKELCGIDIYLGTVYLSPTGNKETI